MEKVKNILVVGASSGIGHECAKLFTSFRHNVIGISRENASKHNNVANYKEYELDITNYQAVINFINHRYEIFDVIIYSAGIDICCSALEFDEIYEELFKTNFFGLVNLCSAIIPKLSHNAIIIPISSIASFLAIPYQSFYSASKAALNAYVMALRNENNFLRFSIILPGGVRTGFSRKRKIKYNVNQEFAIESTYNNLYFLEQTGLNSFYVAKKIYKISTKKHPPIKYVVGLKNKLYYLLVKLLPSKIVMKIVKNKFY